MVTHKAWLQYAHCHAGVPEAQPPAAVPVVALSPATAPAADSNQNSPELTTYPAVPPVSKSPSARSKKTSNTGLIAGICGAVVGCILLALVAVLIRRRYQKTKSSAKSLPPLTWQDVPPPGIPVGPTPGYNNPEQCHQGNPFMNAPWPASTDNGPAVVGPGASYPGQPQPFHAASVGRGSSQHGYRAQDSGAPQPPHAAYALGGFNGGGFFAGSSYSGTPLGQSGVPSPAQMYSRENPVVQMGMREYLGAYAHAPANKVHCSFLFSLHGHVKYLLPHFVARLR
jgi:hypothetical protein